MGNRSDARPPVGADAAARIATDVRCSIYTRKLGCSRPEFPRCRTVDTTASKRKVTAFGSSHRGRSSVGSSSSATNSGDYRRRAATHRRVHMERRVFERTSPRELVRR